ncbi:MAG: GNAT family N-acetyltransferase [Winogradskyella sp.]|jgi:GNAT superfamily N-acetyltransferase|nr:GNAT family N-acetyltransferase [Winogradskyella sp.]
MPNLIKTKSNNKDFINLVKALDAYLKITDGDEHEFYNQFNSVESLSNVVVLYINENAVGCGGFKKFNDNSVEIKRMYVNPNNREKGLGKQILNGLEDWAKELGFLSCILETGKRQIEAVKFYKKCDYKSISKYVQYKDMENSVCFKKELM